jgi:hypothetical protein
MEPLCASVPVLAVAVIFRLWQAYRQPLLRRERRLRERVAYMLWVAANQVEGPAVPPAPSTARSGLGSRDCPHVGV